MRRRQPILGASHAGEVARGGRVVRGAGAAVRPGRVLRVSAGSARARAGVVGRVRRRRPARSRTPTTGASRPSATGRATRSSSATPSVPGNVATDGEGHLVITALKQPGHQCVDGYDQRLHLGPDHHAGSTPAQYGRLEVRAKVPAGVGTWPAFWALGDEQARGRLAPRGRDRRHGVRRPGPRPGHGHRARPDGRRRALVPHPRGRHGRGRSATTSTCTP